MTREFTGKHMALILVIGFGIVVAVNFTMATFAVRGFGGVVVENSYVASQKFNGWLDEAREADKLGYAADLQRDAAGQITLTTQHVPMGATVSVALRRPLGQPDHRKIAFEALSEGRFVGTTPAPEGRWIARLTIASGNERWVTESELP